MSQGEYETLNVWALLLWFIHSLRLLVSCTFGYVCLDIRVLNGLPWYLQHFNLSLVECLQPQCHLFFCYSCISDWHIKHLALTWYCSHKRQPLCRWDGTSSAIQSAHLTPALTGSCSWKNWHNTLLEGTMPPAEQATTSAVKWSQMNISC